MQGGETKKVAENAATEGAEVENVAERVATARIVGKANLESLGVFRQS